MSDNSFEADELRRIDSLKHADTSEKVAFIRECIVELKWRGANKKLCAEKWGLGRYETEALTRKAKAEIFASIDNPLELRAVLLEKIHYVTESAMTKSKYLVDREGDIHKLPDPDHKAALSGLALAMKASGVDKLAPQLPPDKGEALEGKELDELLEMAGKTLPKIPAGTLPANISTDVEGVGVEVENGKDEIE